MNPTCSATGTRRIISCSSVSPGIFLSDTYVANYFVQQVRLSAAAILDHQDRTELAVSNTSELIASAAIVGGFSRLLAEKLLLLEGHDLSNGGSIEVRE